MSFRRRLPVLVLFLALGACGDSPDPDAAIPPTFQSSVGAIGEDFSTLRDRLLAADGAELDAYLSTVAANTEASWDERETAYILQGWRAHGKRYRELLAADRHSTPAGDRHFEWAVGPMPDMDGASPLLHELIVKDSLGPDARDDAAEALKRLAAGGVDIRATELLRGLVDGHEMTDQRGAIASVLGGVASLRMARGEIRRALEYEQGLLVDGLQNDSPPDREVARSLVNLFVLEAEHTIEDIGDMELRPLGKVQDNWIADLEGVTGLGSTVEDKFLIRRMARIGGPRASELIGTYLGAIPLERNAEHAWGVRTARRLPYAASMDAYLIEKIVTSNADFAPSVSPELRLAALDAYRQMADGLDETNSLDKAKLEAMQRRLMDLESGPVPDEGLRGHVDGILDELNDRLGD